MMSEEVVHDRYNGCYILFYLMGVLSSAPIQFFTSATSYWMYKFRNTSIPYNPAGSEKTNLQNYFTSSFGLVCQIGIFVCIFLTAHFGIRFTIQKRIYSGLAVIIVLFLLNIVFAEVNTDSFQNGLFWITVCIAVLMSGAAACVLITLFQLVAKFPPKYTSAIVTGQAICGIIAALAQLIALAAGNEPVQTALIYYGIACLMVVLTTIFFYMICSKSEYYLYHLNLPISVNIRQVKKEQLFEVLNGAKWYIISLVLTIGTTTVIQPGVTSLINSVDQGNGSQWNNVYFIPVITFLVYNTMDFIGRESSKLRWPRNGIVILVVVVLRFSLAPLLMMCNQQHTHMPLVFDKDYQYIIMEILFGLSHGYLTNLNILLIPTTIKKENQHVGSLVSLVVIVLPLVVFSFIGMAFVEAL